jgi:hypothetical protein
MQSYGTVKYIKLVSVSTLHLINHGKTGTSNWRGNQNNTRS